MANSVAHNMDCMEYMKTLPDKYFDLAVVDPPYGDGSEDGQNTNDAGLHFHGRGRSKKYAEVLKDNSVCRTGGGYASKYGKKIIAWDIAPKEEYFKELFRVSRNQIIWGGNYFTLPPTRCFLVWKKLTISETFTMAMAEYAWTSFNSNAKVFEYAPQGKAGYERFHPTQKPIALYEWIYRLYAESGYKILDTHLGSGSSRIAAYNARLDFVGCEIDKTYFDLQEQRFDRHTAQQSLFVDYKQEEL